MLKLWALGETASGFGKWRKEEGGEISELVSHSLILYEVTLTFAFLVYEILVIDTCHVSNTPPLLLEAHHYQRTKRHDATLPSY
jgi:hypothetical protein